MRTGRGLRPGREKMTTTWIFSCADYGGVLRNELGGKSRWWSGEEGMASLDGDEGFRQQLKIREAICPA